MKMLGWLVALWCLGISGLESGSNPEARVVQHLVSRFEESTKAFIRGDYELVVTFEAGNAQSDERERKEHLKFYRKAEKSVRTESSTLTAIWIQGTVAKVQTIDRIRYRNWFWWRTKTLESAEYWILRDGEWYLLAQPPSEFDENAAIRVPLRDLKNSD